MQMAEYVQNLKTNLYKWLYNIELVKMNLEPKEVRYNENKVKNLKAKLSAIESLNAFCCSEVNKCDNCKYKEKAESILAYEYGRARVYETDIKNMKEAISIVKKLLREEVFRTKLDVEVQKAEDVYRVYVWCFDEWLAVCTRTITDEVKTPNVIMDKVNGEYKLTKLMEVK